MKLKCIKKCFHKNRSWKVGEILPSSKAEYEADQKIKDPKKRKLKHFVPIGMVKKKEESVEAATFTDLQNEMNAKEAAANQANRQASGVAAAVGATPNGESVAPVGADGSSANLDPASLGAGANGESVAPISSEENEANPAQVKLPPEGPQPGDDFLA